MALQSRQKIGLMHLQRDCGIEGDAAALHGLIAPEKLFAIISSD